METMTEERCEPCDMPKAFCVHGNPPKQEQTLGLVAVGPTIIAQTYSECPGCGGQIDAGEEITLTDEGWAHSSEVATPPRSTEPGIFDGI